MNAHDFCRTLLRLAREEAKAAGVVLPKRINALESTGQYFVESEGRAGEWFKADCVFEARAKFIHALVDRAKGGQGV